METQAKIANGQKGIRKEGEQKRKSFYIFLKIILEVGERKTRGKWKIMYLVGLM